MCIEQMAIIVAASAAVAAILQAVFAGCLLRHSKRQTAIIRTQTEIMQQQNSINQREVILSELSILQNLTAHLTGPSQHAMEEIGTLELERIRLRPCEDREELLSDRIRLARCTIARGDEELRPIRERVLELERILRDTSFFPDSSSNNAAKPDAVVN